MYEFLLEVKTEYMFKSCSTVKGGDMQANSKGFVISFPGMSEFFVGWEQIASQIVTLINRGEYYTEESVIPTSELANAGEEEYEDDSPEYQEYLRECEPWIELTEEKKELAIKIILIKHTGEIKRKRIYEKYKENPLHSEFVTFIKDEYGHSGFGCDGLTGQTCGKGYKIEPFEGNWTIFLTWAQIASRIVALINRGEYYTETQAEELVQDDSFDTDDYDEADEAYEDMQAEMQTIEQDSEKSLPQEEYDCCKVQKGVAPWLKPDFKNRDGIREFYQAYMSWEQLYCPVPCVEVYRYKFKIGTLYAVKGRVAGILEPRESREIKYSVRYFWQDKGDWLCCETSKFDLEKFIPLHKDEL